MSFSFQCTLNPLVKFIPSYCILLDFHAGVWKCSFLLILCLAVLQVFCVPVCGIFMVCYVQDLVIYEQREFYFSLSNVDAFSFLMASTLSNLYLKDRGGNRWHPCLFLILRENFQSLTIEYDISCEFFLCDLLMSTKFPSNLVC